MTESTIEYIFSVAERIICALHEITLYLVRAYDVLGRIWLEI